MENGPGDPLPFSRPIATRLEPPLQPGVQNPFVLPAVALWLAQLEEAGDRRTLGAELSSAELSQQSLTSFATFSETCA